MEEFRIAGGRSLGGSVRIPGAKNSVLPMMAASLLCEGSVVLTEVPRLSDVDISRQILQSLGCTVLRRGRAMVIEPGAALGSAVPQHLMQAMRSSLFYLAPLLSRTGRAVITQPGGCRLGARPIDLHLSGLCAMGARVDGDGAGGALTVSAPDGLHGASIALRFPSVGATETLLMAAVCARGQTELRGAAAEPEVTDLAHFLCAAGACITGIGTRTLRVMGRPALHGACHAVCPDRITAATVLCAAAGCGGEVRLTHIRADHLGAVLRVLRRAGCEVSVCGQDSVSLASTGRLSGVGNLFTDVYPAFPTDAAPLLGAALLRAQGDSAVTDTVFENRFGCAEGFAALGGRARVEARTLYVHGVPVLQAAPLAAADLRGGAALVLAALQAQGESTVCGAQHIARGYEDMAALLAPLGAQIERVYTGAMARAAR